MHTSTKTGFSTGQHLLINTRTLLFVGFFLFSGLLQAEKFTSNALINSGGISLGVYEAGLNTIIIETLRDSSQQLPKLHASTGSSAGAINALASALRYCENPAKESNQVNVLNNIFRDVWIDIDIQSLLPLDYKEYDQLSIASDSDKTDGDILYDSILNRSIFKNPIDKIKQIANKTDFKADCSVDIGIMVTLGKPRLSNLKLNNKASVEIQEQSYAIPIHMETRENGIGGHILKFYNPDPKRLLEISRQKSNRKYIFLPQRDGEIHIESVIRAALASSAFPVAFGRVPLEYCIEGQSDPTNRCPGGFALNRGEFIDGGYFNNVPIGLAAELVALRRYHNHSITSKAENYIFLDPDNVLSIESESTIARDKAKSKSTYNGKLDLASQLSNVIPGLGTLRKIDMYGDFRSYFTEPKDKFRYYSATKRSPNLTGNFLGAFGAFFDPLFREYDYAAGIYDGLMFSARQLCNATQDTGVQCLPATFKLLYDRYVLSNLNQTVDELHKESRTKLNDLKALIGEFLFIDYSNGRLKQEWQQLIHEIRTKNYQSKLMIVHEAIIESGTSNFKAFINLLSIKLDKLQAGDNSEAPVGNDLAYMMKRPEYWMSTLSKRVLERLIYLERQNDGDLEKGLTTAYIMLANDIAAPENIGGGRFPEVDSSYYEIIPDQIGLDGIQTGISIGWTVVPRLELSTTNIFFEIDTAIHTQFKVVDEDKLDYWSSGIGIRMSRPEIFLASYGVALNINKNFTRRANDKHAPFVGLEVSVGFLADKFRLSLGVRDIKTDYDGTNWSARLIFTNIDELVWAFK